MRPLLAGFGRGSPFVWRPDRCLTAGAVVAAAQRGAAAMPPSRHVINSCESLDHFIVATLATLIAGRTIVLPPTRLGSAHEALRARYPDSICLAEASAAVEGPVIGVDRWLDTMAGDDEAAEHAWPAVAEDHPAAILFTSGSTGAPTAHAKTWGELVDGAHALMRSIARPPAGVAIVGTVPPQHMFGFETTVMLPLHSGTPVAAPRPAFAGDLAAALDETRGLASAGVWLMTTPLQLRAFHRDRPALRGIALTIASTMPLESELALAVERDWHTVVHEIYGCTEGGMLAVRRASVANAWTPAYGVEFTIGDDGRASVAGGHVRAGLPLADRLRRMGIGGAFDLAGRDSDVVKIAGKRASLSGLTRELLALPGVRDGVVFLPGADARRTAALVVAPGRGRDELRGELALRVDPAFLPRPFRLVSALPRDAAGKLALASLRALVAEPALRGDVAAGRRITGRTTFPREHPALPGHFPGNPIVPGVLLLDSVARLLRDAGLCVVECRQAKFLVPVLPEQPLTIRIDIDPPADARFEIVALQRTVATGDLRCVPLEPSP